MGNWWLIGNRHFGVHVARGATAKQAKADVRERIVETFLGEGHSLSAARRGASSYAVFAIAGHLSFEEASEARAAWDRNDSGPAVELARRHRNRRAVALLASAR